MKYFAVYTGKYYYYILAYTEFLNIVFDKKTLHLENNIDNIKKSKALFQITLDDSFFSNPLVQYLGKGNEELEVEVKPLFCWEREGKELCILVNVITGDEEEISCDKCREYEVLGSWSFESLVNRIEKEIGEETE